MELPERCHVYQNHHLDSTRWNYFHHRPGDIVISTSYKAGTTWMQAIVGHLLFPNGEVEDPLDLSPWLDARWMPLELILNGLETQRTRRFIKTHLPLDALPYRSDVQYIVVGRDPRDVFMSLLNHWGNHTPFFLQMINGIPGRCGDAFPQFDGDIPARWRDWITRGWFDWESDGYPYWSHLHHCRSWWDYRHLPNIRLVHFADLLSDLSGQMRQLADYLEIRVPADRWPHIVEACSFEAMKRAAMKYDSMQLVWNGGAATFFNKGTNGRWRDVLTPDDLSLYEAAVAHALPDACARWLESGGNLAP
jgi:aryl sulfotransferase